MMRSSILYQDVAEIAINEFNPETNKDDEKRE